MGTGRVTTTRKTDVWSDIDMGDSPESAPVSYTHLDVYKRQAHILARRQGGRTWLQPDQGGLRSSASLRVRESGPSER